MNGGLRLRRLRAAEYDEWYRTVRDGFADALVNEGGTPPSAAGQRADQAMSEVLPNGLSTPGHAVWVVESDGKPVGRVWLAEREIDGRPAMYVYDLGIDAAHRGKGFGRQTMLLAEAEARERGIDRMELNVFGGNAAARRLYASLGYFERAISMAKDLPAPESRG